MAQKEQQIPHCVRNDRPKAEKRPDGVISRNEDSRSAAGDWMLSIFARNVPTGFRPRWPAGRDGARETPGEKRVDDKRNGDQSEDSAYASCFKLGGPEAIPGHVAF